MMGARHLVLSVATMLLCASIPVQAQDAVAPSVHEPVNHVFAGQTVINSQSADLLPRTRGFGITIQHRFGAIGPDKQSYMQFLGFDLPANIRFGFSYAFCKWFQADLGRSKNSKMVDLGGKFRILKQTVDNHVPVSVSAYLNAAIMTDEFPVVTDRDFFADSVTPFEYRFEHRMYYAAQAMVARKFGQHFSLQLAPIVTYRNLAPPYMSNLTVALPISGRVKVSPKGSILFEYAPVVFGRQQGSHLDPFSIAYEIATAGHVFQIVLSTSTEIIEHRLYSLPSERYDKGYFLLGFNIGRVLWLKPRRPRP
ncbi:MAG: DUF5777 family beta-barrel protein [Flavobacteriales bacterium]|nr:DUF5777 family beta-barrel protein [Flavobacteriales bacterium]